MIANRLSNRYDEKTYIILYIINTIKTSIIDRCITYNVFVINDFHGIVFYL